MDQKLQKSFRQIFSPFHYFGGKIDSINFLPIFFAPHFDFSIFSNVSFNCPNFFPSLTGGGGVNGTKIQTLFPTNFLAISANLK